MCQNKQSKIRYDERSTRVIHLKRTISVDESKEHEDRKILFFISLYFYIYMQIYLFSSNMMYSKIKTVPEYDKNGQIITRRKKN